MLYIRKVGPPARVPPVPTEAELYCHCSEPNRMYGGFHSIFGDEIRWLCTICMKENRQMALQSKVHCST